MSYSEETMGGRPIFSQDSAASAVPRVIRLMRDLYPDWPAPEKRATDSGGALYVITGPEGQELRVGEADEGEANVGLQVTPAGQYLAASDYGALLAKLGRKWQWSAEKDQDRWVYRVTTCVSPEQVGGVRETIFRDQLQHLFAWAASLAPTKKTDDFDEEAARKQLGKLAEALSPIVPWSCGGPAGQELQNWATDAAQLLWSGVNLAVPAETAIEEALAAAALADRLYRDSGRPLGLASQSSLGAARLAQLAAAAPVTIAVPARNLQMGSNPYQLGSEALNLLDCLTAEGTPAIFFGALPELQRVFHGGQGADNDPLQPAVCRPPELPLDTVIAFAVARECRKVKTGGPQFRDDVQREVTEALAGQPEGSGRRIVGQTTAHVVADKLKGGQAGSPREFVSKLGGLTETLGGLSRRPRVKRSPSVQQRLVERITHSDFLPFLETHLLGQSAALREFRMNLVREATTRPDHQPLRVSSLGEPGTGKSESLGLLARWLDMPYVNIDMASLPDPHMAMTQLLGSGTGFVGSDQAGRLERIARHFEGAVVECSDLDHAHPSVQSTVGDMFLSAFETGEAQSGQGHMFSCANLIFAFTLNLPDGKDERMYQRMGFGKSPTHEEVRKDVRRELKHLMSGAFWSRMGDPVLFAPLSVEVRAEIVRRAMFDAARMGLERLGVATARVEVLEATAAAILERNEAPGAGFGARGLLELARTQAACAVVAFVQNGGTGSSNDYELVIDADGQTVLRTKA